MTTVLFIGGPNHGQAMDVELSGSHIIVPVMESLANLFNSPEEVLTYKQILYNFQGHFNTTFGMIPVFVESNTNFHMTESGIMVPEGTVPLKSPPAVSMETLNKLLKEIYQEPIQKQLDTEPWWQIWKQQSNPSNWGWLNAGFRDAKRYPICYGCAEELVGPGFGRVNDFVADKGTGKRVRRLNCKWCGPGKFNRLGQRIGEWELHNDNH